MLFYISLGQGLFAYTIFLLSYALRIQEDLFTHFYVFYSHWMLTLHLFQCQIINTVIILSPRQFLVSRYGQKYLLWNLRPFGLSLPCPIQPFLDLWADVFIWNVLIHPCLKLNILKTTVHVFHSSRNLVSSIRKLLSKGLWYPDCSSEILRSGQRKIKTSAV